MNKEIINIGIVSKGRLKAESEKIFKKGVLLIDVGKGMFDQKSLAVLNNNKQLVHRLDVTPNLNTLIEETHTIKKFSNKDSSSVLVKKNRVTPLLSNALSDILFPKL